MRSGHCLNPIPQNPKTLNPKPLNGIHVWLCVAVCVCVWLCGLLWAVSVCVWLCVSVCGCVFVLFAGCVCLCVAVLCVAVWLCVDGSISLEILDGYPTVAVVAKVRLETSI